MGPVIRDKKSFVLMGQVRREALETLVQTYHDEKMSFFHNFEMLHSSEPLSDRVLPSSPNDHRDSYSYLGEVLQREAQVEEELRTKLSLSGAEAAQYFEGTVYIPFEDSPVQLLTSTPLAQIHLMFVTLRSQAFYVTHQGVLLGVV